jgi:hypothetical protein
MVKKRLLPGGFCGKSRFSLSRTIFPNFPQYKGAPIEGIFMTDKNDFLQKKCFFSEKIL